MEVQSRWVAALIRVNRGLGELVSAYTSARNQGAALKLLNFRTALFLLTIFFRRKKP